MEYHTFQERNCYTDRYGRQRCSRWSSWGRWVVAGVAILFFLLLAMSCLCVARRRRKRGTQPFYGTGWMAPHGKHGHHQQQAYGQQHYNQGGYGGQPAYGQQNYNQGAATGGGYNQPYASPPAYGGGGQQDGYYGGQQYGVQAPAATYQQSQYAPPQGPPPGK